MTGIVNSTTGMEHIAREMAIILLQEMNNAVEQQETAWGPLDEEWALLRNVPYEPVLIERIPAANFHLGTRPSLIKASVDAFPNVTVMADLAAPDDLDDIDQMNKYSIGVFIQIFVKGATEAEVNARIQRTAEAANICVLSNPTLRGYVQDMDATPTIGITDVNVRREKTAYGNEWFMQGARIEYQIGKAAVKPSGDSSFLAPAPASQYAGINIDQA